MPSVHHPLRLCHRRRHLWTYRDRDGNYLDGARNYRLHVAPGIPAKNFWSVVVYDALSRSALQNGQPLPSVSVYSNPKLNADESVDIAFGPDEPKDKGNWIKTVPGQGMVSDLPLLRPDAEVLRQDVEARGHRGGAMTRRAHGKLRFSRSRSL